MLKTLMMTTAAGALLATAAFAQSPSTSSPPESSPPAASTPPAASPSGSGAAMGSGSFVATQKPDQWLASKFRGTDVVGSDDQKIGDVSDILFDKQGKIEAFVVSVGGFLGMGAKDVAMPPSAFQIVADTGSAGTTGTGGAATTSARDPNDIKLKVSMTKDELKNAQAFEHYKAPSATGSAGGANRPAGGAGGGAAR